MRSSARIRSTRYCDMLASSDSPRTTSVTRRGEAGEVEDRLPGGVGRPDDVDLVAGARPRPGRRSSRSGRRGRRARRCPRPRAGGRRPRWRATTLRASMSSAPSSRTARTGPRASRADDVTGEHHLGAEPAGLRDGALGEVGAGEPPREAEVVLDRGALPGLPARGVVLDDDGAEALGRGVDRGGEPGRSAADDAEVVEVALGAGAQAERRRDGDRVGRPQRLAVGDEDERQVLGLARRRGRAGARPPRRARRRARRTGRGCWRGRS